MGIGRIAYEWIKANKGMLLIVVGGIAAAIGKVFNDKKNMDKAVDRNFKKLTNGK